MPVVMIQNNFFLSILQERLEVKVSDHLRSYTNPSPIKRLFQVKIKKKKPKKPRSKEEKLARCL